jgi:hypothetical protein
MHPAPIARGCCRVQAAGWRDSGQLAPGDYRAFTATAALGFVAAGSYALMFLGMLLGKARFFLMGGCRWVGGRLRACCLQLGGVHGGGGWPGARAMPDG